MIDPIALINQLIEQQPGVKLVKELEPEALYIYGKVLPVECKKRLEIFACKMPALFSIVVLGCMSPLAFKLYFESNKQNMILIRGFSVNSWVSSCKGDIRGK